MKDDEFIGKPQEPPKDDSKDKFWVHKNLYCTLQHEGDGVYVSGFNKEGGKVFGPRHFPTAALAMGFIDHKKEYFQTHGDDNASSGRNSSER